MKKILLFCYLFLILCINTSNASIRITNLKDNNEVFALLKDYKIYKDDCEKMLDRLSVIEGIEYYNFNNELKKDGIIIVMDVLADNVVKIFKELKKIHFNINVIHPTAVYRKNWYGGIVVPDDFNGTESFVCRMVEHTDLVSLHSFGVALDINFLQNPCVFIDYENNEIQNVVPKNGVRFLNRSFNRKGKQQQDIGKVNQEVVEIFKKYGYDVWGGYWDFPIDYQHFQVSTSKFTKLMVFADKKEAKEIFNIHTRCVNNLDKSLIEIADEEGVDLLDMYKNDKKYFFNKIRSLCKTKNKKNKS